MRVTPEDLLQAADTLEKLSAQLEYSQPDRAMWTASEVRGEVSRVREAQAQELLVTDLAVEVVTATIRAYGYAPMGGTQPLVDAVADVMRGWEITRDDDPFAS